MCTILFLFAADRCTFVTYGILRCTRSVLFFFVADRCTSADNYCMWYSLISVSSSSPLLCLYCHSYSHSSGNVIQISFLRCDVLLLQLLAIVIFPCFISFALSLYFIICSQLYFCFDEITLCASAA